MDNNENFIVLAMDFDAAGRLVGRAILANDEEELHDVSERIELGGELIARWAEESGGKLISSGGDEATIKIPRQALENIEHLRQDCLYATNLTITVGVGNNLSEAGKSLLVGKFRGKDMVVIYDQSVEKELHQAQENVKYGNASAEERKLTEAYLKPEDGGPTEQPEEQAAEYDRMEVSGPEIEKPKVGKEDNPGKTESYDEEKAMPKSYEENNDPQHDKLAIAQRRAKINEAAEDNQKYEQEKVSEQGQEAQAEAGDDEAENQHSESAMRAIAREIAGDTPVGETEKDDLDSVDDEDLAIGDEMEGNISRRTGYKDQNKPGDIGLDEKEAVPDLNDVLRDGLDNHADNIQKEKIGEMVAHALEGFKANKHILEKAKEQAPELYDSCIAMLRAMIEMAKTLGLNEESESPDEEQGETLGDEQAEAQEEAMAPEQEASAEEEQQAQEESQPDAQENDANEDQIAPEVDTEKEAEPCPYCDDNEEEECPYCQQSEGEEAANTTQPEEDEENCPYCQDGEDHEEHKNKPRPQAKPAAPQEGNKSPKAISQ